MANNMSANQASKQLNKIIDSLSAWQYRLSKDNVVQMAQNSVNNPMKLLMDIRDTLNSVNEVVTPEVAEVMNNEF